jgi:hypothetical protein
MKARPFTLPALLAALAIFSGPAFGGPEDEEGVITPAPVEKVQPLDEGSVLPPEETPLGEESVLPPPTTTQSPAYGLVLPPPAEAQSQGQEKLGGDLMTPEERFSYRNQMRQLKTIDERRAFRSAVHKKLLEREKDKGRGIERQINFSDLYDR